MRSPSSQKVGRGTSQTKSNMKKEIKKDSKYWVIHKEIYTRELDKLDSEIAATIQTKPYSKEASMLNDKVDTEIERLTNENPKVAG
jgi:hypothetical protein